MYKQFVSLGQACPVSASMSKYGLRSWSGPFDWLIANDFKFVLHYIENDFEDFLLKENLRKYKNSPKMFIDLESGFTFLHDKDIPFETQYDKLKSKYEKKINNFLEKTKEPTCFLRGVMSTGEIDYINNNIEYIDRVIKKYNVENEIVFLIHKGISSPSHKDVKFFEIPGAYKGDSRKLLRGWFDGANEFLTYCVKNFDEESLINNITFDRNKEETLLEISERRCQLLCKIAKLDYTKLSFPAKNIIIFGLGEVGLTFYHMIKDKVRVTCFIDDYRANEKIDNIPVLHLDEVELCGIVIVTPTHNFEKISQVIRKKSNDVQIVSLDEIEKFF